MVVTPSAILGPCCACGRPINDVAVLALLPYRAPVPGIGWACAGCGTRPEGAVALICTACRDAHQPLQTICPNGWNMPERMALIDLIQEPFPHGPGQCSRHGVPYAVTQRDPA